MDETKKRGFAAMDPARQREISSKGGKRAHELGTAHEFDTTEAAAAGKLGGRRSADNRKMRASVPVI